MPDLPVVLLLTDAPRIARATELLLRDWGYATRMVSPGRNSSARLAAVPGLAGIVVDLLSMPFQQALCEALTLRDAFYPRTPMIIHVDSMGDTATPVPAERVMIQLRSTDPDRIRIWLRRHADA